MNPKRKNMIEGMIYFQRGQQLAQAVEILTQANRPDLAQATLRSALHCSMLDGWLWLSKHGHGKSKENAENCLKANGYDYINYKWVKAE